MTRNQAKKKTIATTYCSLFLSCSKLHGSAAVKFTDLCFLKISSQ